MEKKIIYILIGILILGLVAYFGFMEFIRSFPFNG